MPRVPYMTARAGGASPLPALRIRSGRRTQRPVHQAGRTPATHGRVPNPPLAAPPAVSAPTTRPRPTTHGRAPAERSRRSNRRILLGSRNGYNVLNDMGLPEGSRRSNRRVLFSCAFRTSYFPDEYDELNVCRPVGPPGHRPRRHYFRPVSPHKKRARQRNATEPAPSPWSQRQESASRAPRGPRRLRAPPRPRPAAARGPTGPSRDAAAPSGVRFPSARPGNGPGSATLPSPHLHHGASDRNRTRNPVITNHLLYH